MENTYWSGKGLHQADYTRLVELMPGSGNADTLAGELVRACTRLAYDLYNNGMGNNTSGAVNMLRSKGAIDAATHATIYPLTRGAIYNGGYNGDSFQLAVESAIDQTIEFILAGSATTTPNTEDMFTYEDEEQRFCEDCGCEQDYHSNMICEDCELELYAEEEDY
jgi:hypothetical protein